MYPPQQPQQIQQIPQRPSFFEKNKLFLLGGGLVVFFIILMVSFGGSGDSTGFVLFGADPNELKTCQNDLNSCTDSLEIRDAQLAAANKSISIKDETLTKLTNEKINLNLDLNACTNEKGSCLTEKQALLSDNNVLVQKFTDCNNLVSGLQTDLNFYKTDLNNYKGKFVLCDLNLTSTTTNWVTAKNNLAACDINKTYCQSQLNYCTSDKDTFANLYQQCNSNRQTYESITSYRISQIQLQIKDMNVENISDTNTRINATKIILCDLNAAYC